MTGNQKFSAKKYIKNKARSLPFHEAIINSDWETCGMASILLSKIQPSNKFLLGVYLVDIMCLGLKDSFYEVNLTKYDYDEFINKFTSRFDEVHRPDITYVHNLIYGAIDFAEELGFRPCKEFAISEFILDPDLITDEIDEIEFGKNGMPSYFAGPYDDVPRILKTLDKNIGRGNYHYTYGANMMNDFPE